MAFTGKVGDACKLKDTPPFTSLYIIVTNPNTKGDVVVMRFVTPIYGKQTYVMFSPRHSTLFAGNKTVAYTDAKLLSQQTLISHAEKNPQNTVCFDADIVRDVVIGAFCAEQSENGILEKLNEQYPDLYEEAKNPPK